MSIENYISFSGTLGLIIAIALNIIVGIVGGLMAEKKPFEMGWILHWFLQ
jgi:hypothetical protein